MSNLNDWQTKGLKSALNGEIIYASLDYMMGLVTVIKSTLQLLAYISNNI